MKVILIFLSLLLALGCSRSAPPVVNSDRPINAARQSNEAQSVLAHTTENQTPKPGTSNGGKRPMSGEPIDTSKFDEAIAAAEKESKSKPSDATAKNSLAEAYFERGVALTDAKQYASALGDYRRAVKLDPTHEESKKWIDQITNIYAMMKREAPKDGEEPPPMPFKKPA